MRCLFCRKLFIILMVVCFCYPCYGQIEISLLLNGQSEQDYRDLQFYLVSIDTTRIAEVPLGNGVVVDSETLLEKFEESVWMAIIKYKKDYYMLGFINSTDFQMLSPSSEVILLSRGIRKYGNNIVYVKNFKVIWKNITTYGKCTQSSWKTKKQCINNARKIIKKASIVLTLN